MKKCNKKTCSMYHDTKYKWCPTCLEIAYRYQKKRKRLAESLDVPEGKKMCTKCFKHHGTKYKRCQRCRDSKKRAKKKRRQLLETSEVPEGKKLCKNCLCFKAIEDFHSIVHRRAKLTTVCKACRTVWQNHT